MLVGRPVLSRILSTICPLASSNTMMESGYAPINTVAPDARPEKSVSSVSTESNVFIDSWFRPCRAHIVYGCGLFFRFRATALTLRALPLIVGYGKTRSRLRQSLVAAAHLLAQSG